MEALEQSTAFINFAEDMLKRRGRVERDFTATDEVLSQFEFFLRGAGFRAPQTEWQKALPWIRRRIQAEALTLGFGMQEGERVETAADPQVQAAVAALVRARQLLSAQSSR
jgi:hypothetical protein